MHIHPMGGRLLTRLFVLLASGTCIQHTFAQDACTSLVSNLHGLESQLQAAQNDLNEHTCAGTAKTGCIKVIRDLDGEVLKVENLLDKNCAPGSGVADLPYAVITVLYALPGNLSEVKYENGSTTGSRSEVKPTTSFGLQVHYESSATDVDLGYQFGSIDGQFLEIKKEASKSLTLTSQIDSIDHEKDMFYLWVNPEVTIDRPEVGAPVTSTLQVKPGQSMQIVALTAEELLDPSKIPDKDKPLVAGLKTADYSQILSSDPFLAGAPLDPNRFVKVDTLQLDGPDEAGDPISGNGLKVGNESASGSIEGTTQKVTVTMMSGFEFLGQGAKIGGGWEWDYENTTESSTGQTQEIEVVLRTSTVLYHDNIDVYLDSMFNSFAYVSKVANPLAKRDPHLWGTVKDRNGEPVFNALVEVTAPDGTRRRVFSNSRGVYRLFDLANVGDATVRVGSQQHPVILNAVGPHVLDFNNP